MNCPRWARRIGLAGIAFFALKGIGWLIIAWAGLALAGS
jgi:hypothetical protein